jgi:hypothetical protein
MLTNCDLCKVEKKQEDLVNIDPAITEDVDDLKEEYKNFDGMVCPDCYTDKMITLKFRKEDMLRAKAQTVAEYKKAITK